MNSKQMKEFMKALESIVEESRQKYSYWIYGTSNGSSL